MVSAHLALSVSARSSHGLAFALHPRHRRERMPPAFRPGHPRATISAAADREPRQTHQERSTMMTQLMTNPRLVSTWIDRTRARVASTRSTARPGDIQSSPRAQAYLWAAHVRRERLTKNGSLGWPDGSQLTEVWPIAFPRAAWEHAVAEAQVEDFTFHDCRHHFASWFMMRGGTLQALQAILGHRSLAMTTRYAHLSPDHIRGEMLKTERRGHPGAKCWNRRGGTGRLASGRLCGGTPG